MEVSKEKVERSESMDRDITMLHPHDQFTYAETQTAVAFFQATDEMRSKVRRDGVELVELIVLKRKLRDWTQAVMERMEWEAQRMQEEEDGQ